jgi:hypothetical protein
MWTCMISTANKRRRTHIERCGLHSFENQTLHGLCIYCVAAEREVTRKQILVISLPLLAASRDSCCASQSCSTLKHSANACSWRGSLGLWSLGRHSILLPCSSHPRVQSFCAACIEAIRNCKHVLHARTTLQHSEG